MKRYLFAFVLLACVFDGALARVAHLLPVPKVVRTLDGSGFRLRGAVAVDDDFGCAVLQEWVSEWGHVRTDAKRRVVVKPSLISFSKERERLSDEWYQLRVERDSIVIEAVSAVGVIRAVASLRQLAMDCGGRLESVEMMDYPSFAVRGWMHDVGRSFVSMEELKREIRLLSQFKVNLLHLHLTENQAWRFEVKGYPQLTDASSMSRDKGKYYTQEECLELSAYARKYGVTIMPEIDMPGHSDAFRRALGFDMQTEAGKSVLKEALSQLAGAFPYSPYLHIGADEVQIHDKAFISEMIHHVHQLNRKVALWIPAGGSPEGADLTTLWSTAGRMIRGIPAIDSRYNYINHFDVFADVVGIYRSNVYYRSQGDSVVLGSMAAVWNDHALESEKDIVCQNNLYASVIASACRAWTGGGDGYIEELGTQLPYEGEGLEEFVEWENRFLYHKQRSLREADIPYVRQGNVCWMVSQPFPNGGSKDGAFAPEDDEFKGMGAGSDMGYETYRVRGAGIYLRHTWGKIVPTLFGHVGINHTAYAWTNVYSPKEQDAGALIEFQNYSRSENDIVPEAGCWDRKGSRIWLNGKELEGPDWNRAGERLARETPLTDENLTGRAPVRIHLRKGWNRVFLKLPYVDSGIRLNKWMFTFVITDTTGRDALPGIEYHAEAPSSNLKPQISNLKPQTKKTAAIKYNFLRFQ